MKSAVRKTEAEMKQEAFFTPIRCGDYRSKYDYWQCENCHVLFEPNDTVLLKKFGDRLSLACPMQRSTVIKRIFFSTLVQTSICQNQLYGGDKAWYDARYKISEYVQRPIP
jgi:hypothetical protein